MSSRSRSGGVTADRFVEERRSSGGTAHFGGDYDNEGLDLWGFSVSAHSARDAVAKLQARVVESYHQARAAVEEALACVQNYWESTVLTAVPSVETLTDAAEDGAGLSYSLRAACNRMYGRCTDVCWHHEPRLLYFDPGEEWRKLMTECPQKLRPMGGQWLFDAMRRMGAKHGDIIAINDTPCLGWFIAYNASEIDGHIDFHQNLEELYTLRVPSVVCARSPGIVSEYQNLLARHNVGIERTVFVLFEDHPFIQNNNCEVSYPMEVASARTAVEPPPRHRRRGAESIKGVDGSKITKSFEVTVWISGPPRIDISPVN